MTNLNDDRPEEKQCECSFPQRAVTNVWFPVTYDEKMGEYQLILDCGERGMGSAVLHYCPWCGGLLPKSKRDTFFTVPTEADETDVAEKMASIKTVEQMRTVLGEPSLGSSRAWLNQYTYSDTWESLDLVIFEYDDGHLGYHFGGKHKSGSSG